MQGLLATFAAHAVFDFFAGNSLNGFVGTLGTRASLCDTTYASVEKTSDRLKKAV
ncbi:hypothetical protein HMPREF9120_01678 [Neisseria sp. oral taxon 020 str. F0370]|nr:hypothetical protein HMPREF9120_01678 [Neisseria sp. oral taxon 020 str. F0370]